MGLVTIADFSRGLWVAGAKAHSPLGTLRRARGVSPLRTTALQSRPGSVAIRAGVTAHSLARFGDVRFYGVGDTFQRGTATVQSGLNGNRLRTVRMPPTSGIDDYLMVAGGGELFKVQTTGSATKWGIAPPADGMTATLATQLSKDIQLFEDFTDWAEGDESDPPTLADEATIVLEGTNALKATIPSNTAGEFDFSAPVSLNLAQFATGSTPSPDEDYIQLWVHINRPQRVQAIGLAFEIAGPGTFDGSADFFSHESKIEADISKRSKQAHRGLGDLIFVADQDAAFLAQAHARPAQLTAMQALGRVDLIAARNAWSRLRVPKAAFDRSGNVSTSGWDSITAIRLTIRTNSGGADSGKATKVYFDACTMIGSVGMIGDYQWLVTFRNSATGTRSNANATPTTLSGVLRQGVDLADIPVSSDAQVDQREIWRTLGNGSVFFKAATIDDNTTTTYADTVADYIGLHSLATEDALLTTEELPTDNIAPFDTFIDCAGPHRGRVWWIDSAAGNRGNLYYSPADRAEAVDGFIIVSADDNATQRVVNWNNQLIVFVEEGLYAVQGIDEPFEAIVVGGAPPTTHPDTVVATEAGILYRAADGIRLFNGVTSTRLGDEPLAPVLRGESAESLGPFVGTAATYARGEYFISDGSTTLALSVRDGTWREVGVGFATALYEKDTDVLLVAFPSDVVSLESAGALTDIGTAIPFEAETPSAPVADGRLGLVRRLWFEADTGGAQLTPTLVLDDGATLITLPLLATASKQRVEYAVGRRARLVGVRLAGSLTAALTVDRIEADVYTGDAQSASAGG